MVSTDSIFLDLENAVNDLIEEQGLNEEQQTEINTPWELMKRDVSQENLIKQTGILQAIVDNMVTDVGLTPALMLVQARLGQLRVLFDLRDKFEED